MTAADLRSLIQSTLTPIGLYSRDAEELLMATAANESHLGEYRRQVNGPAIGIFQEEPEDFRDIDENFLAYREPLLHRIDTLSRSCTVEDLENNDRYAIAICRVHYLRAPEPIPSADDLEGIWNFYKRRYNSADGAANERAFMACYRKYVLGVDQ